MDHPSRCQQSDIPRLAVEHTRSRRALIVVDLQNDFLPGGLLEVTGGEQVIPVVNTLALDYAFDLVVYTQDWHPQDHCSFSQTPSYQHMSWPSHCVANSWGAKLAPTLVMPNTFLIVRKGTDRLTEALSGFHDTHLQDLLHHHGVTQLVIVGLALDYCVKQTVLDAIDTGFHVTVVKSGTRSITDDSEPIFQALRYAGAHIIDNPTDLCNE